jgi:hypothetical protein
METYVKKRKEVRGIFKYPPGNYQLTIMCYWGMIIQIKPVTIEVNKESPCDYPE